MLGQVALHLRVAQQVGEVANGNDQLQHVTATGSLSGFEVTLQRVRLALYPRSLCFGKSHAPPSLDAGQESRIPRIVKNPWYPNGEAALD